MALSKSSTVITLSAIGALAFAVGCGTNNSSKTRTHANHSLKSNPATPPASGTAKSLAVGDKDKKAATGIAGLMTEQGTLQGQGLTSTEQLVNGKYELQQVQTYYVYHNTHPVEDLGASNTSTVAIDASGAASLKAGPGTSFGAMTADSDSPARKLDLPISFTKTTGWQPSRDGASNIMLADAYVNGTVSAGSTTAANGSLTDMFTPAMLQQASVMGILASTQISHEKAYIAADETGVKIYMRLLSVDAKTLRIWVSFEEKRPNATASTSAAASETIDRNIYLDYKITPEAATQTSDAGPAATPAADATTTAPTATDATATSDAK